MIELSDHTYPAIDRVLTILRERLNITSSDHDRSQSSIDDVANTVLVLNDKSSSFDDKVRDSSNDIEDFLYYEGCIEHDHHIVDVERINNDYHDERLIHHRDDHAIVSSSSSSNHKPTPSKLALIAMMRASEEGLNKCIYRKRRKRLGYKQYIDKSHAVTHLLILQHSFDAILRYNHYCKELYHRYQCLLRRLWDEKTAAVRFNESMKLNCIRRLGKEKLAILYDKFRYDTM